MTFQLSAVWLVLCLLHGSGALADAQTTQPTAETPEPRRLALYIDCKDIVCDHNFFRTEIAFVTHVRERQDANVHILITGQPTAAGGSEATLKFIGQKEFAGVDDSLRYVSRPAATEDQVRTGLANAVKRGLVRYANRTPLSEDITVLYAPPAGAAPGPLRDPWDHWTFTTSLSGFLSGEELVKSMSVGLSASADRTTDDWKISTSAYSQYNRSTFQVGGARSIASIQRSHAATALVVNSVDDHMSIGGRASVSSSSFLNQSLTLRLAPAAEYNLFPYRDSTRRMFTLEYLSRNQCIRLRGGDDLRRDFRDTLRSADACVAASHAALGLGDSGSRRFPLSARYRKESRHCLWQRLPLTA